MSYTLVCSLCHREEPDLLMVQCAECGGFLYSRPASDAPKAENTDRQEETQSLTKAQLRHNRKRLRQGKKGRVSETKFLQKYLTYGVQCPFCASSHIWMEVEQIEPCRGKDEDVYASRPMTCFVCEARWFDVYKLFDIDVISLPKG